METNGLIYRKKIGNLDVRIFQDRERMGKAAASDMAEHMLNKLAVQKELRIIFAAAPSQNEFLQNLVTRMDIPWNNVIGFHMDEYIGIDPNSPQGFGNFLKKRIFKLVAFKSVHYFNTTSLNPKEECKRYATILSQGPIDIITVGIGENGHLAFNDPPVADFNDPLIVKIVELDNICRQQQVNDGCFSSLNEVPKHAYTITIPEVLKGEKLFCMVPGPTKAAAVLETLTGDISVSCPSTILRQHPNAILYIDIDSAALYRKKTSLF